MTRRGTTGFTAAGRRDFCFPLLTVVAVALLYPIQSHSRTWYIKADGSGDAPTIQAGLDSSTAGDSLLLADGTYAGAGNRNIHIIKDIFVGSEMGDPSRCIMDCESRSNGVYVASRVVIDGITIKNGSASSGGGAVTGEFAGLEMMNCLLIGNSSVEGGAVFSLECEYLEITNCVFDDNSAELWGGAVFSKDLQSVIVEQCIFTNNSAPTGDAIYAALPAAVLIGCCDIAGNEGGDWVGGIEDREGVAGNFSADPEYCGVNGSGNYYLQSDSPCAPGNHPDGYDCGLIGALPVNCGEVSTRRSTWGAVKAKFGREKE